jgi:hypothetical protein
MYRMRESLPSYVRIGINARRNIGMKKLKTYFKSVIFVFAIFILLMTVVFAVLYFPVINEGFGNLFNCDPATWGEANETFYAMLISSVVVCPLFALFVYPLFED